MGKKDKHKDGVFSPSGEEWANISRRHRREKRFRFYGAFSISVTFIFLAYLLITVFSNAMGAFSTTEIRITLHYTPESLGITGPITTDTLSSADFNAPIREALKARFPDVTERGEIFKLYGLLSRHADDVVRKRLMGNPSLVGSEEPLWLPASSDIDLFRKGEIDRNVPETNRSLSDRQIAWYDTLKSSSDVTRSFNRRFFTEGDSREPESAGILGGVIGSLFVILSCMALAFPLGLLTAIYLEEFAPTNRYTDIIEVNINNLAAVPSIVFGLLGLWLYLNILHLPRSSSLAGGFTLAMMILPIIIITTRNSLKSIPPSIRDAARALGASPMQVILHHILPLSLPGIMTGTILGIARAFGETAPLLMIGMVAFVADIPHGVLDPASAMPVQIYLWADSPEAGFREKTSAAIMVLLCFLILANAGASYVRRKYERKW